MTTHSPEQRRSVNIFTAVMTVTVLVVSAAVQYLPVNAWLRGSIMAVLAGIVVGVLTYVFGRITLKKHLQKDKVIDP